MAGKQGRNKRKRAVVDVRVQWTLALRVIFHFCLFICIGTLFGLMAQFMSDPLKGLSGNMEQFWNLNGPYLLAMGCMLPVFVYDTLKVSNRIVGPICRMRHTIRQLASGEDAAPLKFRKGDLWSDLPASFNTMVDRLRGESDAADADVVVNSEATGSAEESESASPISEDALQTLTEVEADQNQSIAVDSAMNA